jgi:hypothetical protein
VTPQAKSFAWLHPLRTGGKARSIPSRRCFPRSPIMKGIIPRLLFSRKKMLGADGARPRSLGRSRLRPRSSVRACASRLRCAGATGRDRAAARFCNLSGPWIWFRAPSGIGVNGSSLKCEFSRARNSERSSMTKSATSSARRPPGQGPRGNPSVGPRSSPGSPSCPWRSRRRGFSPRPQKDHAPRRQFCLLMSYLRLLR